MEDNIFKQRINEAKEKKEKIKILFQYPGSSKAIVKSGYVIAVADNGFSFDEVKDGEVTYSYNWIAEIVSLNNEGGSQNEMC